jgi:hypothetical protein
MCETVSSVADYTQLSNGTGCDKGVRLPLERNPVPGVLGYIKSQQFIHYHQTGSCRSNPRVENELLAFDLRPKTYVFGGTIFIVTTATTVSFGWVPGTPWIPLPPFTMAVDFFILFSIFLNFGAEGAFFYCYLRKSDAKTLYT